MMTEAVGWLAALGSMMAFGSFGVPMKSNAANSVDIDPLVFQTYKSFVCFVTSWLVLLVGVPWSYTPWGIVSCLFWVPGGIATVFAIRNAGLAIAMGMGGSMIVLVSFIWGIFVFDEPIHSRQGATFAIIMMMIGILGMSYFSSPQLQLQQQQQQQQQQGAQQLVDVTNSLFFVPLPLQDEHDDTGTRLSSPLETETEFTTPAWIPYTDGDTARNPAEHLVEEQSLDHPPQQPQQHATSDIPRSHHHHHQHHDPLERLITIYGISMTRRQLGIAAALFNGIWGGSIMVPMKWCHDTNTSGVGYLISFGIGAAVVTTICWCLRFIVNLIYYRGSCSAAFSALPSFHLKVMWRAGGTSGLLWSIGNFFSIMSVYSLGEGVGYSVVQAGMMGKILTSPPVSRRVLGCYHFGRSFFRTYSRHASCPLW
jgi:glucose uptake protein GlcU